MSFDRNSLGAGGIVSDAINRVPTGRYAIRIIVREQFGAGPKKNTSLFIFVCRSRIMNTQ